MSLRTGRPARAKHKGQGAQERPVPQECCGKDTSHQPLISAILQPKACTPQSSSRTKTNTVQTATDRVICCIFRCTVRQVSYSYKVRCTTSPVTARAGDRLTVPDHAWQTRHISHGIGEMALVRVVSTPFPRLHNPAFWTGLIMQPFTRPKAPASSSISLHSAVAITC